MGQKAEVNLIALPQTMTITENDRLVQTVEVPDGLKAIQEIAEHTEGVFGAIRIMKAVHLFEATKVTFEENT